jgi:riboflavin synthase
MFTGIIEEIGTVDTVQKRDSSVKITVCASKILSDIKIGDSIAVNGICLTAAAFSEKSFTADIMHETLLKTALSNIKRGSKVNLERAMPMNGRFGGHIVTGHIDGTGTIIKKQREGIAVWYTIKAPAKIMKYIVEKGSVAIDGISLTVADLSKEFFRVSVIPHTLEHTVLAGKAVNEAVNLENDCIGKYIEKFLYRQ